MRSCRERWARAGEVVSLSGDDVAHATPGIRDVAGAPRNDMDMEMWDGLAASCTFVEANVEAVHGIAGSQESLCFAYGIRELRSFCFGKIGPNPDVPLWH